jgi:hypothetical protein
MWRWWMSVVTAIENANEAIQVLDCFYKANVKREDKDKINY